MTRALKKKREMVLGAAAGGDENADNVIPTTVDATEPSCGLLALVHETRAAKSTSRSLRKTHTHTHAGRILTV